MAEKTSPNNINRRPPASLFVWIFILALLIGLLIWQYPNNAKTMTLTQSEFELNLEKGMVKELLLLPDSEPYFWVKGKLNVPTVEQPLVVVNDTSKGEKVFESMIYLTDSLMEKIKKHVPTYQTEAPKQWVKTLVLFLPFILLIAVLYFLFARQLKIAGKGPMMFGKSKGRLFLPDDNKVTFDDIAGAEEAKEEVKEIVDYLRDPLKFKLVGGHIPRGALLTGAPGTGKTLLAKAVAGEANVAFFAISGSDFVEMFVGVGASRVRDMFEQARKHVPCLIFIDEIDAVGRSRFSGIGGGHDEREQTLNAMLVEMDGLETQEGVIILAATNRADVLDPALLRPGRFDRQIVIDLPDIKGRLAILNVHVKKIRIADDVDLPKIARTTPGFSGADLANVVNEAALLAARNNFEKANESHFEEARDKVKYGRERRSLQIPEHERVLTAYHEAGHTLIALYSKHATPVHKVTIIPRGQAYLGATMTMDKEDRYTHSRSELWDELKVLMGGRIAEELTFNEITTGASGDIEQATKIARSMVCAFGMSELGTIQYVMPSEAQLYGRDTSKSSAYSAETAREIDMEIRKIIKQAYDMAHEILESHKNELELLAKELLEKETMDLPSIQKLLGIQTEQDSTQS